MNDLTVVETYTNGCGYVRVCMVNKQNQRIEYTINIYNHHMNAYDFPPTHETMGRDIELDAEVIKIVKEEYNKYWEEANIVNPYIKKKIA